MDGEMAALVNQYQNEGYVAPVEVFSKQELANYQAEFQLLESHFKPALKRYLDPHLYFRWARELAAHPRLVKVAESILGPELLVMGCMILCKRPATDSHFPWHQDGYFYPEHESSPYLTAWIALSPSTRQNGCMEVIPASHLQGIVPHEEVLDPANMIRQKKGVNLTQRDDGKEILLSPGEMSLHHGATLHRSFPNQSAETRVGFILRITTPTLQKAARPLLRILGTRNPNQLPMFEEPKTWDPESEMKAFQATLA